MNKAPTSFSPDGKYLLFVEIVPDKPWDIWVLALDGREKDRSIGEQQFQ